MQRLPSAFLSYVDMVWGEVFLGKAKGLPGVAAWGVPGALPPGRQRNSQKFLLKNQWKITNLGQFFIILMKISRIFRENLWKM